MIRSAHSILYARNTVPDCAVASSTEQRCPWVEGRAHPSMRAERERTVKRMSYLLSLGRLIVVRIR